MRRPLFLVLALILVFPALAYGENVPSDHRWALGYDDGIVLRRFLGENWDVYLGGRPSISSSESENQRLFNQDDNYSGQDVYSSYDSERNSAYLFLGVSRSLVREGRFWLAGLIDLQYYWSNSSSSEIFEYPNEDAESEMGNVGHYWISTLHFGLRPAFDLTRRITIMVEAGIALNHYSSTRDYWSENPENISWVDNSIRRTSGNSSDIDTYGFSGINSIQMMFRF